MLRANEKFIFLLFSWIGGIVALRGIENLEGGMFKFADWGTDEDLTFIKIYGKIKWGIFIHTAIGVYLPIVEVYATHNGLPRFPLLLFLLE